MTFIAIEQSRCDFISVLCKAQATLPPQTPSRLDWHESGNNDTAQHREACAVGTMLNAMSPLAPIVTNVHPTHHVIMKEHGE